VVSQSTLSEKLFGKDEEGVANLSTDSDYNYLADCVNANPLPVITVTCLFQEAFYKCPDFDIER